MKGFGKVATVVALALPMATAPLAAQSWRADAGINVGGSWYSSMLGSDQINDANGNVRFRAGWLTGAQLGFWITPRIGIRANGTYTDRSLKQGNSFMGADQELYGHINLWSGSGDLLLRLKTPAAEFTHVEMLPYIALGVGAKWHNPAGDAYTVYDPTASESWNGVPFTCGATCTGPGTGTGNFFLSEERVILGLVGLGEDVRLAPRIALRLEVGDRMYKPALIAVTQTTHPGANVQTTSSDTKVSKMVHEIYAQAGLHMLFGLAAPPVVAVVPAPAPPPPPPPVVVPVITTQNVNVCVVDPTTSTGLRTVTAVFNTTTNDTTIMVNGQGMKFSQSLGTVPTATGATWYVQGQPLTVGTGNNALAYVSYGSARNIDAGDLAFVGTINGMPVYANKSDVSSLTIPSPAVDISTSPTLLTGLRNVQVLYAPLTVSGCNFQPLQIQQQVRKVRG